MKISKTSTFSSYVEKLLVTMCVVGALWILKLAPNVKKNMQKAYNFESNMCDCQDVAIFHTITP